MRAPEGLPSIWWKIFLLELPLIAGTVLYALFAPAMFAGTVFGIVDYTPAVGTLTASYASVIGTMVGWFYARILLASSIHLPTFRRYQEALLLGDIGIIAIWALALANGAQQTASAYGGIAMAALWGGVRIVYLIQSRATCAPAR